MLFRSLFVRPHVSSKKLIPSTKNFEPHHFKTVEDIGVKIIASRSSRIAYLCTKFHENLPSGSKVISGTHTHRLVI
jgi:hypothetical protein